MPQAESSLTNDQAINSMRQILGMPEDAPLERLVGFMTNATKQAAAITILYDPRAVRSSMVYAFDSLGNPLPVDSMLIVLEQVFRDLARIQAENAATQIVAAAKSPPSMNGHAPDKPSTE